MPRYDYRCPVGHVTERQFSMSDDLPEWVHCEHTGTVGGETCDAVADRVFAVPAAIHFRGPGFYETDYRGRYDRKRRPNPGDDLPLPSEAAITKAEGAEYDPPKQMPSKVHREDAKRAA